LLAGAGANAGGMVGEEFRSAFGNFVPGSQLASYRIVEQIGRGGMAVVYRARDIRLDRWVALKILAPDLALDQVFRQRFIRESRAAAAVDHPNIIPIFEAGEADGVLFIAMRFVGGQDVRSLIDREGTLPAARAAGIVAQVASALDAAHACGLVHRDVKPANMLLSDLAERGQADHVYLSDFGVSKQSDSTSRLTSTGQLVGTLDYLAPEQVEGRPVDGRADVYSLACAAFEMLAGVPPFKRDQSLAVLWAQLSAPPPLLTSRRSDLPPAIDQVMAKALAKSPGDRYDRCLDFASSLQRACGLRAADVAGGASRSAGPDAVPRSATVAGLPGVVPGFTRPAPEPSHADRPAKLTRPSPEPPHADRPAKLTRPAPEPPYAHLPPKRPSRRRLAIAAACIAVLVLAGGAVALLRHRPVPHPAPRAVIPAASPASTVRMYISAINNHDYARAWRLGGDNSGSTYPGFVHGFGTTERDTLTILSVSGDVVTARVAALQTNGTVNTYQGTYTVDHGVISKFDIRQVS
jgi:serine/threonine protein kinase